MFLEFVFFIKGWDHISLPRVKAPQAYPSHLGTGHSLCPEVMGLDSVWKSSFAKWSLARPLGPFTCIYGYQITMQLCWPFKDLQYCLWWEQKPLLIAQTHRRSPHIPNKQASLATFSLSPCSFTLLSRIAALIRSKKTTFPFSDIGGGLSNISRTKYLIWSTGDWFRGGNLV